MKNTYGNGEIMIKSEDISEMYSNKLGREEIKNTLIYSLGIEFCPFTRLHIAVDEETEIIEENNKTVNIKKEIDVIEEISIVTRNACAKILDYKINGEYDFFGSSFQVNNTKGLNKLIDLDCKIIKSENKALRWTSLEDMMVQDAVLACYHMIMQEFTRGCTIKGYRLGSDTFDLGIDQMIKGQRLIVDSNKLKKKFGNNDEERKESKSSRINKKYGVREKLAPNIMGLFGKSTSKSSYAFNISTSKLCKKMLLLTDNNYRYFKDNWSEINNSKLSSYWEEIYKTLMLFDEPIDSPIRKAANKRIIDTSLISKNYHGNITDYVYQLYLAERITNVNLLYELLSCIKDKEEETNYRFSSEDVLDVLVKFVDMPNPFSRLSMLRYAFAHINKDVAQNINFWKGIDFNRDKEVIVRVTREEPGFQFDRWLGEYKNFVLYFSKYAFPVYHCYFYECLMDYIDFNYPEKSYLEKMKYALDMLSNYICRHCDEILIPIIMGDWSDRNLTVALEKKQPIENLLSHFKGNKKILFEKLASDSRSINLDMTFLTRSYFGENEKTDAYDHNVDIMSLYWKFINDNKPRIILPS
jgi:hypothetical protein